MLETDVARRSGLDSNETRFKTGPIEFTTPSIKEHKRTIGTKMQTQWPRPSMDRRLVE
jgi:hypothetical protein